MSYSCHPCWKWWCEWSLGFVGCHFVFKPLCCGKSRLIRGLCGRRREAPSNCLSPDSDLVYLLIHTITLIPVFFISLNSDDYADINKDIVFNRSSLANAQSASGLRTEPSVDRMWCHHTGRNCSLRELWRKQTPEQFISDQYNYAGCIDKHCDTRSGLNRTNCPGSKLLLNTKQVTVCPRFKLKSTMFVRSDRDAPNYTCDNTLVSVISLFLSWPILPETDGWRSEGRAADGELCRLARLSVPFPSFIIKPWPQTSFNLKKQLLDVNQQLSSEFAKQERDVLLFLSVCFVTIRYNGVFCLFVF